MKSLYLRIYATVVVVLLLFALVSGWIVERHLDDERARNEQVVERPARRLGRAARALAARRRRRRPRCSSRRCATGRSACACRSRSTTPRASGSARPIRSCAAAARASRPFSFKLDDGRTLWTMRPGLRQGGGARRRAAAPAARAGEARPAAARAAAGAGAAWPCCCPGCRAAPGWRSSSSSSSSPSPPAPIRSCAA